MKTKRNEMKIKMVYVPLEGEKVWMEARRASLGRCSIGEYIIQAVAEKLARERKEKVI